MAPALESDRSKMSVSGLSQGMKTWHKASKKVAAGAAGVVADIAHGRDRARTLVNELADNGEYDKVLEHLPRLFILAPGVCIDEGTKLSWLLEQKAVALLAQGQVDMSEELLAFRREVEQAINALLNTLSNAQLQRLLELSPFEPAPSARDHHSSRDGTRSHTRCPLARAASTRSTASERCDTS